MASFDIVDEEYIEESKEKSENEKHEEKHGILEERFQKGGRCKQLQSKFRRVLERCPLSQFYTLRTSVTLPSMLLTSNCNGSS